MELKMYVFGEDEGVIEWVCATSKEEAIRIYKSICGEECWNEITEGYGDQEDYVREMSPDEEFTYYHDGATPDKDTIANHIKKYCTKPDMFACSEF